MIFMLLFALPVGNVSESGPSMGAWICVSGTQTIIGRQIGTQAGL